MPTSSGQITAAWSPAATPRRVWPSVKRAFSDAMLMSASSATASPAPTATPLMAEMIGLSQLIMLWTMSRASFIVPATTSRLPMDRSTTSKSPPAENALPAPVMTATRTSGSSAMSSQILLNS